MLLFCCLTGFLASVIGLGTQYESILTEQLVIMRNGTEWYLNETESGHIVIDVDPFEFIYEDQSVLFVNDKYVNQGIDRQQLKNITDQTTIARYVYEMASIQFDWKQKNIYWLQANIIEVSDVTGTYRCILYSKDMEQVNYMVIDPNFGYMFWSDGGVTAKIERASMHGDDESRITVIAEGIQKPFGLATDSQRKHLYWGDTAMRTIERCSYSGEERVILIQLLQKVPGHMTYFNGTLYWVEQLNKTLNVFSHFSNTTKTIAFLSADLLQGAMKGYKKDRILQFHLRIYDELFHKKVVDLGDIPNDSKCDHLGLTMIDSSEIFCKCSAHFKMTEDGSCTETEYEKDWKIIFSSIRHGISEISNGTIEKLSDILVNSLVLIDNRTIVYTLRDEMYTSSLENISAYQTEVDLPLKSYTFDLEYDWIGDNLYWAINDIRAGWVMALTSAPGQKQFVKGILNILGVLVLHLELDIQNGLLFAVDDATRVGRFPMDGDINVYKKHFLMKIYEGYVIGLSVDTVAKTIYLMVYVKDPTSTFGVIHRCTYDGKRLKEVYSQLTYAVAFIGNYRISYEDDKRRYVYVQCDRSIIGNCKTISNYLERGEHFELFRIYPAQRNYSGNHPCQFNNGYCAHFCLLSPVEPFYRCDCHYLASRSPNKRTCELNPCETTSQGNCSMKCHPLEGFNYTCSCSNGFVLASDGKRCLGKMGFTIIERLRDGWELIDISSNHYTTLLLFPETSPRYHDYDPVKQELYWVPRHGHSIIKMIVPLNINEGEFVTFHDAGILIKEICVDWLARHVYLMTYEGFRQTDLKNMSNYLQLQFIDLFLNKLEDDVNNPETKFKTEELTVVNFEVDVFNGHLYCVIAVTVKDVDEAVKIFRFETTIFIQRQTKYEAELVIEYYEASIPGMPITIDSLENQMYYGKLNDTHKNKHIDIYVCNVDGTGNEKVISRSIISVPVRFDDDYLYFVGINKENTAKILIKMKTNTYEIVSTIQLGAGNSGGQLVFNGVNLQTANKGDDTEQCQGINICWSSTNAWSCLESSQICDGVNDCYNGHDEHYCSLCTSNCSLVSFKMTCYSTDLQTSKVANISFLSDFIRFEESPVSKLLTITNILTHDCFIRIQMESAMTGYIQNVDITSLQRLHKLRQVILSPLFSKLDDVRDADLTGGPFFADIGTNGIGVFENVRSFKIEKSLIVYLLEDSFQNTSKLANLTLFNNYFLRQIHDRCFSGLKELNILSITGSNLGRLAGGLFVDLTNLTILNLSNSNIRLFGKGIFDYLVQLRILDLRRNDIKLTSELFLHTDMLQIIYCDSFTICCIKPKSVSDGNCSASKDDISSCSNLIENRALAAFLWIFGIMAFCGNLFVVIYRGFIDRSIFEKSYYIFIYNLSLSDLLMSVYMLIIAVHDARYDGIYVWNDYPWRNSILCRFTGMISMVSSETSMMFVCLITLERYICVKFAFGTVRLSLKQAVIVSVAVWLFASLLSVIPTLFYPEFYSRSGVCIGIPLTQNNKTGLEYSAFVFLGLNFIFSVIIPFGQYHILDEVRKSSKRVQSTQTGRNAAVAKRLAVVVITDCLCWLPIGILVILSLTGIKISREVYAWVIICVLPINAAVNPYLYTLSDVKWDKVKQCFSGKKKGTSGKIKRIKVTSI